MEAHSQSPFPGIRILWLSAWFLLSLTLFWPTLVSRRETYPEPRLPASGGYNYLVIAPVKLYSSAQAWVAYRQERGYRAVAYVIDSQTTSDQIRWVIHEIYHRSGDPYPFYVLLLGHAHPISSYPDSYLPPDRLRLSKGERSTWGYKSIPGDGGYAYDHQSDKWLPIAIGRIPAMENRFALGVLARVQQYESQPPVGEGRNRLEIIASSTAWGAWIDQAFERLLNSYINSHLPEYIETHVLTGNPDSSYTYPLEDMVNETVRRFDSGALLVSYIGHGGDDMLLPALSQDGFYTTMFSFDDLDRVQRASDSVMTFVACDVGQFDLPGDRLSLAEAFLLDDNGPVATYAASRITFPLPNAILEMDLLQMIARERIPTVGQWLQRVRDAPDDPFDPSLLTWLGRKVIPYLYVLTTGEFSVGKINPQSCYPWQRYAYNLFGDPALALAYPTLNLKIEPRFRWLPFVHKVSFTGDGPLAEGQTIYVSLNYPAGATPEYSGKIKDQRFIYARTNSKTLTTTSIEAIGNGQFAGELRLPSGLPAGRYVLQAIATTDKETLIGSKNLYVGLSPSLIFGSISLWWLLITVVLWSRLARNQINRLCSSGGPEKSGRASKSIALSRYLKPNSGYNLRRSRLDQKKRRNLTIESNPSREKLKAIHRKRNPDNDHLLI
jgi:hypothetical protein